ncbi:Tetratricopeptide TPR_2 repeat protein [Methanocaldococcus lauensis]|uniref:Tetratricopeptide TPR_2 repeat protein n=2 Tax=Methanocaldococcus lauensis TaxID=2546128 RepID=A0A8D6PVT7_9EURY|nr:Tetratricopeptide TPR_2 repeat protein [Methanocaldococcus lauensis]
MDIKFSDIMVFKKFLSKLISKDNLDKWILKAEKYLDESNYQKAVECYLKAISENYMRAIDWANLAYAYFNLEEYEKALDAINKAISLSPKNLEFIYLKGMILYKLKDYDGAYKCFIEASRKIKNSDLYELLGELSLKLKKYEDALNYYLKSYKLNEKKIDALYNAGKLYLLFGDIDNAYESFKKILEKEPNHECKRIVKFIDELFEIIDKNIYEDLIKAVNLIEIGNYINALKFLNKIISIDESNDFAYYYKSVISEIFEEYHKALEYIKKSISLFERSIFYAKYGDILNKINSSESVNAYNKSIEIYPNPYAYFGLSIYYYKKGDFEKSAEYFDKLLEITTYDVSGDCDKLILYSLIGKAETSNNLKYYEEALSYLDNLINKNLDDIELWKIRGYIYFKLKNYKIAYDSFMNVLKINPNDIDAIKSIIVVYEKAGKYDEAISMAMKLKKLLDNKEEVDKIIKKLMNKEPTNLDIFSPLLNVPVIYCKIDKVQYHFATLHKYININPILAYIYLFLIENLNIIEEIYDEDKSKSINNLIEYLKEKLPVEMYKYCESPENYKPNDEIINTCKRELAKFGFIF